MANEKRWRGRLVWLWGLSGNIGAVGTATECGHPSSTLPVTSRNALPASNVYLVTLQCSPRSHQAQCHAHAHGASMAAQGWLYTRHRHGGGMLPAPGVFTWGGSGSALNSPAVTRGRPVARIRPTTVQNVSWYNERSNTCNELANHTSESQKGRQEGGSGQAAVQGRWCGAHGEDEGYGAGGRVNRRRQATISPPYTPCRLTT